ncbi:Eco29kI family restriction endonuclease [Modestobacter sp. I12A-02628]|uniref:Eco29kI family restriction endonuclease n=1 Tax=Goekera deserti TaxID=2497753 RepID=A0A7K3WJN4_9ACTN|nr:Eco29kI family restriction endonuclease [Goekera deserti]NDI48782.1 Eco29kI family restriction endonuclease [Goekera deserti]NEL56695.1 Eco29kI family restriction endonuclease [Goekera deserti]
MDWAQVKEPVPYDPLSKVNLGRSVETALLRTPVQPLEAIPPFRGAGIYAIYYAGNLEMYQPLSGSQTPIYVGKAVPAGARKGQATGGQQGHQLWDRLDEHRGSVDAAGNLDVGDFYARYLVADELFIPMAERLMITGFQPVWNLVVDGFGNHDPGAGRLAMRRPPWDELHPGRGWAARLQQASQYSAEESGERIKAHFIRVPPVRDDVTLAALPATELRDEDIPATALDEGPDSSPQSETPTLY